MQSQNYTTSFTVEQSPAEVYDAINDVRGWWTGAIEGESKQVGDEFAYRYSGFHYSKQEIVELVPGTKVVWRVTDSRLEGPENASEWTGTEIIFEITAKEDGTEVRFAHRGLVPEFECFESCSSGWGFFVNGSLRRLITTGEGPTQPPWA
ncbi:MAG: SRPBCC domain-containing protein [Acidimicrobiales bacterium]|jgi:hypothetical protein